MSKNLLISADAVAKPPRGAEIAAHVPADPPVSSDAVAKSPHGAGADGEYDTNPLASIELYSQKWEVRDKVNYTPSPPPFFMHKIFEQSMPNLDVLIDFNTMHFENTRWNDEFDARHHGLHAILTKLDTRGVKFDVLASSTNLPWLESCMYPFFLHLRTSAYVLGLPPPSPPIWDGLTSLNGSFPSVLASSERGGKCAFISGENQKEANSILDVKTSLIPKLVTMADGKTKELERLLYKQKFDNLSLVPKFATMKNTLVKNRIKSSHRDIGIKKDQNNITSEELMYHIFNSVWQNYKKRKKFVKSM